MFIKILLDKIKRWINEVLQNWEFLIFGDEPNKMYYEIEHCDKKVKNERTKRNY